MIRVESILKDASLLTEEERRRLVELLCRQLVDSHESEEKAGRRGLNAWTESTRGEDWSSFYPESLPNAKEDQP